jgi:hypothetical protein
MGETVRSERTRAPNREEAAREMKIETITKMSFYQSRSWQVSKHQKKQASSQFLTLILAMAAAAAAAVFISSPTRQGTRDEISLNQCTRIQLLLIHYELWIMSRKTPL